MGGVTRTVVLSGPPGVGKSTIGRRAASLLGLSFTDLDAWLEQRTEMSAGNYIRAQGEARFRALEVEALGSLGDPESLVALGGGTLTTRPGREAARALGPVVHLSASPATLAQRLSASDGDRPLLVGDTVEDALAALLGQRRTAYRAVDRIVDAEGDAEPTAERVAEAARGLRVLEARVGSERSRILVGRDLAQAAAGAVANLEPRRPMLVLLDLGAPEAKRGAYLAMLEGLPMVVVELEGGESVKTWASLGAVLERALEGGCGRQSAVLALGGGATCDLGGLAAHLLGRGAPLVLVPTTLLAQADAAVGGKCATNMGAGRNLIGAFHAASDVLVDLDFLATLPRAEYVAGAAEVLKMGLITDAELFRDVVALLDATATAAANPGKATSATAGTANPGKAIIVAPATPANAILPDPGRMGPYLTRAIAHKAAIVARDPYERGDRKLLNLGHTLGHALEAGSDYTLRHGEAVSIGLAAVARLSRERGWLAADAEVEILEGLRLCGLPTSAPPELLSRSAAFLGQDKKGDASAVDLVALEGLGRAKVVRLSWDDVAGDLARCGGSR